MYRRSLLAAVASGCLFPVVARAGKTLQFHGALVGAQEVPPNNSPGAGHLLATFDNDSGLFIYELTYHGLSGPPTGAHFHGPAHPGQNAPVAVPIGPSLTSPIRGRVQLNQQQAHQLTSELWYVNIHTERFPGGEIRAQVVQGSG